MSELGRLVAEHAKAVMTADHASEDLSATLATPSVRPTEARPASGIMAAASAAMIDTSPIRRVVEGFQQQHAAAGRNLAAAMIERNLEASDLSLDRDRATA
jgi:hypothetical protein